MKNGNTGKGEPFSAPSTWLVPTGSFVIAVALSIWSGPSRAFALRLTTDVTGPGPCKHVFSKVPPEVLCVSEENGIAGANCTKEIPDFLPGNAGREYLWYKDLQGMTRQPNGVFVAEAIATAHAGVVDNGVLIGVSDLMQSVTKRLDIQPPPPHCDPCHPITSNSSAQVNVRVAVGKAQGRGNFGSAQATGQAEVHRSSDCDDVDETDTVQVVGRVIRTRDPQGKLVTEVRQVVTQNGTITSDQTFDHTVGTGDPDSDLSVKIATVAVGGEVNSEVDTAAVGTYNCSGIVDFVRAPRGRNRNRDFATATTEMKLNFIELYDGGEPVGELKPD